MQLLSLLALIPAYTTLVSSTFVDLDRPHVTLRKHYHTILKYTTLHRFGRHVKERIDQADKDRQDAIGRLARVMKELHNPHVHPHRTTLAYSSFYALVWALKGEEWRNEVDWLWADALEAIKKASTCKHCPRHINRYLQAYRQGKASVFGSRFGKGRLARPIMDDPKACFLKRPQLRQILRKLEVELVRLYLNHLPDSLAYHLRDPYEIELAALQEALSTPVDERERAVLANVTEQQQPQQQKTQNIINQPDNKQQEDDDQKWHEWIDSLKANIKGKWASLRRHHGDDHNDSQVQQTTAHQTQCGCNKEQKADTTSNNTDDSHRQRFMKWLQNIRRHLPDGKRDNQEFVVVDDSNNNNNQNNNTTANNNGQVQLQGAIVEERHQVITQ